MMRKVYNLKKIILICLPIAIYSQSNNVDFKLSEIIPPSIDNYNFVKYGNISINNNTGAFSHNIPLYSIKDGSLNTNISLSYYNEGVKVNDIAGIVGMGWNLNAGGMITRIVRDEPDEYSESMTFRPDISEVKEILDGNYTDSYYLQNIKEKAMLLYKSAIKTDAQGDFSKVDNEQDWFNFNFDGYSGSFFIDNGVIHINSDVEGIKAKVEKDSTFGPKILKFTFIMPNGKKYILGGSQDYIESSELLTGCTKNYGQPVTSAWFLQNIIHDGSIIKFKYKNFVKEYMYDYSEGITIGNIFPINTGCGLFPKFNECVSVYKSISSKAVSEINTDFYKILFDYEENRDDYTHGVFLNKIDIFNGQKKIKTIGLKYYYSGSSYSKIPSKLSSNMTIRKRLFLEEINFGNNEIYNFEYNDSDKLPARFSYAQDYFGYANSNEKSSLLNIDDFDNDNYYKVLIKNSFPSQINADRSVDPFKSIYGSIVKINYPTRGRTTINYENHKTIEKVSEISNESNNLSNEFFCSGPVNQEEISSFEFRANGSKIYIGNYVDMIKCEGVNVPSKALHKLEIKNKSKNIILYSEGINADEEFESQESTVAWPGTKGSFPPIKTIDDDIYEITYTSNSKYFEGVHNLSIYYNFKNTEKEKEINYSGARVGSLVNFDGIKEEIKYVKYNKYENLNKVKTSIVHNFNFNPWDISCVYYCGDSGVEANCKNTLSFSSTNYINSLNARHNRINYEYLAHLEYSRGVIVNKFEINNLINTPIGVINQSPKGTVNSNLGGVMNGKLLESKYYNSYGDLLQEKINIYNRIEKHDFTNYVFDYNLSPTPSLLLMDLDHVYNFNNTANGCTTLICNLQGKLNGDLYKNVIESYLLEKQKTINYLNGIPIQTMTEYFYNNPSHYQLTSQTTTFPDGTTQETQYQYAQEKGNTVLVDANMIGIPLETEVKKNGLTISKTETKYDNPNLLLPTSLLSYDFKNNAETALTYDQYDSKGNLQQYTTKDGLTTAIIWGYNQTQPIAKIEGTAYADISGSAATIIATSNEDANVGSPSTESDLINELDKFRKNHPALKITTYTYDPLIGVRSITPPSGIREYYIYDTANRLQEVRDVNDNILKQYEYNYKH